MYFIAVDYFSNFFKIDILTKITTKQIIHCVKKHFSCYGIPKVIVSDCGSQFISYDFSVFCKKWHITHITSSPGHQQENGKAEAAVKAAKHLLKTTARNDEAQALLELRNTSRQLVRPKLYRAEKLDQ